MKIKFAVVNRKPLSCLSFFIGAIITAGIFLCGAGADAATPDQVSGLIFWLKADAGVTQAEGKVSAWADQSLSKNNAAQAAPAQPTYVAEGLNGKPVIRFTGAPATICFNQVKAQTVFVVYKDNGTTDDFGDILGDHLKTANFHGDGASSGKLFSSTYAAPNVLGAQGFVDGVATSPAAMTVTPSFHIYTLVLSSPALFSNLANNQDQGNRFRKGDYAEVIAFSGALKNDDRHAVEAYLAGKYAIAMEKNARLLSVYADGDSVTSYPNNYTVSYKTDIPCVVVNVAVSGQSQAAMLSRLPTSILTHNPDIITLSTFLNDMSTEPDVLDSNIISYVNQVLAHKNPATGLPPQLILMTDNLSGQNLSAPWPRPYEKQVETANRVIATYNKFADNPNIQIVNNFASFDALGGAGNPDSEALFSKLLADKVHPNAAGYDIFHANIKAPLSAAARRVLSTADSNTEVSSAKPVPATHTSDKTDPKK